MAVARDKNGNAGYQVSTNNMTTELGEQMGQDIARAMDFDIEMLLTEKPYHCSCGKVYKTRGWFRRHYVRGACMDRADGDAVGLRLPAYQAVIDEATRVKEA